MSPRHVFQVDYHDIIPGFITHEGDAWWFTPYREYPQFQPLHSVRFPSQAAVLAAMDQAVGREGLALLDAEATVRQKQRATLMEEAQAFAREHSYVGECYDADRPLAQTARLILGDIRAAVQAGTLPPDTYRVTASQSRRNAYTPQITLWSRHIHTHEQPLLEVARRYNRLEVRASLWEVDDVEAFSVRLDMTQAQYTTWKREHHGA